MRSFKVVTLNKKHTAHPGRYMADAPMAAAKKAFTQYCRRMSKKGRCAASIGLQETTRGSKKTIKYYAAHRKGIKPHVNITRDGVTYKSKYETVIHAVKPAK